MWLTVNVAAILSMPRAFLTQIVYSPSPKLVGNSLISCHCARFQPGPSIRNSVASPLGVTITVLVNALCHTVAFGTVAVTVGRLFVATTHNSSS
jgi:hypothetical protein